MARILAIDFGLKRTGLAVTDPLQMIASPLETIPTAQSLDFVSEYLRNNDVEAVVIGVPVDVRGAATDMTAHVKRYMTQLQKITGHTPVIEQDERFTSSMAKRAMIDGGMSRKNRRIKGNVDKISAALILQSYLAQKQ